MRNLPAVQPYERPVPAVHRQRLRNTLLALLPTLALFGAGLEDAAAQSLNRSRSTYGPGPGLIRGPIMGPAGMNRITAPSRDRVIRPGRYPGTATRPDRDAGTHKPRRPRRPPTIVRLPPLVPPVVTIAPPTRLAAPPPGPPPARIAPGRALPASANLPPANEQRYVPDEVLVSFAADIPQRTAIGIAQRQRLALLAVHRLPLINSTLYRFRITDGRSVPTVIAGISRDRRIARVQPNYLYTTLGEADAGDPAQYVLGKLDIAQAHALATGGDIRIAIIDSSIDADHPDLQGTVVARFDAVKTPDRPDRHGTAMASAIAAHGRLTGIAPAARLLAARAFDPAAAGATRSTTARLLDSLQWAASSEARIVNMSFAGPADPRLRDMLVAARRRGMVLIAAAGNAGPTAAPAYPAAYPEVIAVTATDSEDKLFAQANRGPHVAIASPGVGILVAAPNAVYDVTSGTSVAAAHVSGLAALLLERHPRLTPDTLQSALMRSARDLGEPGRDVDYGAGLANALAALNALTPQTAERTPAN